MKAELAGPLGDTMTGYELINGAARLMESLAEWRYLLKETRTLTLRAPVTGSAASYNSGTETLTLTGAFADYALVPGDHVEIVDDGTIKGRFDVLTRVGDDAITVNGLGITTGNGATITFTVDTGRILLPADVERILRVYRGRPNSGGTFVSSPMELHWLDESYITGSSFITGYAFQWGTLTAKSAPVPVLRYWPPSTTTDVDALSTVYMRAWPVIDAEADVLPIPAYMETLFIEICRAFAKGFDSQERLDVSIAGIQEGSIYVAAARYDSGGLRPIGRSKNKAVRRRHAVVRNSSAEFIYRHIEL